MSRRIVPTIYYKIGDAFLTGSGNVLRVTSVDPVRQTYELKGSGFTPLVDMDQDNLFSMVKYGTIKYLGKEKFHVKD
jgi:hypothetical protein